MEESVAPVEPKPCPVRDCPYPSTYSHSHAATDPTDCPCECHKPKHEARKPHPATMAGRMTYPVD